MVILHIWKVCAAIRSVAPRLESRVHNFGAVLITVCLRSLVLVGSRWQWGVLHSKPELAFKTDVKKKKSVADAVLFSILSPPVSLLFT